MKKMFVITLALFLAAGLAACGNNTQPDAGEGGRPVETGGAEIIELSFLNKYPEDHYRVYFEGAIRDFEAANPHIRIKMESVGDEQIKDKLRIIAGGELPDIFFTWAGEFQRKFDRAGLSLDLTPYLEQDPEWAYSFVPAILESGEYEGRNHSIPFRYSCMFMLYNKPIFDKYDLSPPADFDEFLAVCEVLKQNGETPLLFGNGGAWYGSWYIGTLNQLTVPYDIKMRDYNPRYGEFTHPGYEQAFQILADLRNSGYFSPNVLSADYFQNREQFCAGQGAMMMDATSQFIIYENEAVMEWGFFKFPAIPGAAGAPSHITGGAEAYCVSAASKHPDEAVQFLKFLTSREQAYKQTKETGLPNPIKGGIDLGNGSQKLLDAIALIEQYDGIAPWLDTDVEAKVADAFMVGVSDALGGKDPAVIMQSVRAAAREVAEGMQ